MTARQKKASTAKTASKSRMLSGADILLKVMEEHGVDTIFGYPGGAVLPIYDALFRQKRLRHILVRHEQGAVHAAEGYARSSGKPGVVLVTSGPGATNTVTGLTDAMMDSIPVICISGQVPTHMIGNDAFQEADTVGITRPCTKHNYLIKDVAFLAQRLREAFYVATHGRPGPVLVDIPKDIQIDQAPYETIDVRRFSHPTYRPTTQGDNDAIEQAISMLLNARRPIFYVGGGVINSGPAASQKLRSLTHKTGVPLTQTLMALGAFPTHHRQSLGMLGMHGTYEANMAMYHADLIVAIGARFDDRVTGRTRDFSPESKRIHIDIDASSFNKSVRADLTLLGDCREILTSLERSLDQSLDQSGKKMRDLRPWWKTIEKWRQKKCLAYTPAKKTIRPQHALDRLNDLCRNRDPYITTEVGQHQMWAAQYLRFDHPNRWMTSGGLGTMGYGLPAAIGVQIAHPDALVIDVAGEASILMNIQELSTAVQYRLPVKIFILNNHYMGMVRQWQELLYDNRISQSYTASLPDFVALARAFGLHGLRAEKPEQLDDVIGEMLDHQGPVIADICVDRQENCFPMIPAGAAHNEMLLGPKDKADPTDSEEGMVLV